MRNFDQLIAKSKMHKLILLSFLICINLVKGQCPQGTTVSFEKVSNVNIKGANLVPLYTGVLEHMPVSAECNNRCRAGSNCRAFIINYSKHSCVGIGYDTETSSITMVPTDERTSYFDKICLTVNACEKAWTFERVIGHQLIGFDDRIVKNVANRLRCQELCLRESQFSCRSGEYDHATLECRLSTQDRRTQNSHFVVAPHSVDYFENQCSIGLDINNYTNSNSSQFYSKEMNSNLIGGENIIGGSYNCGFRRQAGLDIYRADLLRSAHSEQQCEQLCEGTKAFVCRSFSYRPALSQCSLNSDDSHSIGGQRALAHAADTIYFERSSCVNLNLDCRPDQMEISLNTVQPFSGKIYAKEDVNCKTVAKSGGSTQTSLVLPIQGKSANTCGIKADSNGKYHTIVVIQHHPLIQRKGDRIIRLVCNFETSTQIVTNNYHVLSHMEHQGSTVVNASATSPEIRLRITDANGQDVQGTKLGEQLQLRIELKNEDSALDMQATHLMAMSGHTQQQIALIDSHGCPTDPNIFPALEKLPGTKTLVGRFDAFKFADDVVVRFQVNVHFCVERCRPLNCIPGRSSVDIDAIEDNELSAANERISLLKKEESLLDSNSNSTEHNHHENDKSSSAGDQLDVLAGSNGGRSKLLNEENNRVRREAQRPKHKFDRDDQRSKTIKQQSNLLPDAALQREIIVEGLSSHEHDYQAKLLYTKSEFNPQYCTSRNTLVILGLLALFTQVIAMSICCVCCRNHKFVSSHDVYLNQLTSRQRKQFNFRAASLQSSNSSHSSHQPLPNQMSNYFNRVD